MTLRPTVVLAMVPLLTEHLFSDAQLERLRALGDVPDPTPLTTFEEPRTAELLQRADFERPARQPFGPQS